jgi:hypothetical protein
MLRNNRAGGVDVGHHLVGVLVAAVGVVALSELKIGGGEFLGGIDRASTPSRLNSAKASSRSKFKLCCGSQDAVDLEIAQKGRKGFRPVDVRGGRTVALAS